MADSIKLILVEDEILVAYDIQSRLGELGYSIAGHARSSDEALELVKQHQPDLVLMDIDIKGDRDGIETAAAINKLYTIPIVYLTKFTDQKTFEKALKTIPAGYVNKPFQTEKLSRAIDMAIAQFHQMNQRVEERRHIFYLKVEGLQKKFYVDELVMLEADGAYCKLTTTKGHFTFSKSQAALHRELSEILPDPSILVQIHRSVTVSRLHVEKVGSKDVSINGESRPIGSTYRKPDVYERLRND